MDNYTLEKYKRDHKFNVASLNRNLIQNSTRDECCCKVIGTMVVGQSFYISAAVTKK